jgi:hypothetical protein
MIDIKFWFHFKIITATRPTTKFAVPKLKLPTQLPLPARHTLDSCLPRKQ